MQQLCFLFIEPKVYFGVQKELRCKEFNREIREIYIVQQSLMSSIINVQTCNAAATNWKKITHTLFFFFHKYCVLKRSGLKNGPLWCHKGHSYLSPDYWWPIPHFRPPCSLVHVPSQLFGRCNKASVLVGSFVVRGWNMPLAQDQQTFSLVINST